MYGCLFLWKAIEIIFSALCKNIVEKQIYHKFNIHVLEKFSLPSHVALQLSPYYDERSSSSVECEKGI